MSSKKDQDKIAMEKSFRLKLLEIDRDLKLQNLDKALLSIKNLEALVQHYEAEATSQSSSSSSQRTVSPGIVSKSDVKFDLQLKLKLLQLKTACYLAMRSLKSAKRECKLLFSLLGSSGQSQNNSVAMHLKAYHDYLRGNMKKSLRIIKSIPTPQEKNNTPLDILSSGNHPGAISSNNEGCCHFYLGRPVVASWYFQNAFKLYDEYQAINKSDLPPNARNFDRSFEVLYNFGVTMLHIKESIRAFNALTACLPAYFCNPRLWLRIAECCIQVHKSTNENDLVCNEHTTRNLLEGVVGEGNFSKLIFSQRLNEGNKSPRISEEKKCEIIGQIPTLQYASVCIDNALHLIRAESVERDGILFVKPSNPLRNMTEINALHAAVLCAGSYISLSIENYVEAVKRSQELLSLKNLPGAYDYLGRQYLSQALFNLGEENEAILLTEEKNYNFDLKYCVSPTDGGYNDDKKDENVDSGWNNSNSVSTIKPIAEWYPKDDGTTAKMALVYNRACMMALAGHYEPASHVIKTWITTTSGSLLPAEFLMLAIYIHIKLGNLDKARSLLKEPSPHTTHGSNKS